MDGLPRARKRIEETRQRIEVSDAVVKQSQKVLSDLRENLNDHEARVATFMKLLERWRESR